MVSKVTDLTVIKQVVAAIEKLVVAHQRQSPVLKNQSKEELTQLMITLLNEKR